MNRRGTISETEPADQGRTRYVLPLTGYSRPPLTLNGRVHWRTRAKHVKQLRTVVAWRAREVKMPAAEHIDVALHYVPKDARVRDEDNIVATMKPCIDALTDAGSSRGWVCVGIVPDDSPDRVSWSRPRIHPPDDAGPRLWLEVTLTPREGR